MKCIGDRPNSIRQKNILIRRHTFCHWCVKLLNKQTATLDHVVPLSEGGEDNLDNAVLACGKCNWERGQVTEYLMLRRDKLPKLLKTEPERAEHHHSVFRKRLNALSPLIHKWYDKDPLIQALYIQLFQQ